MSIERLYLKMPTFIKNCFARRMAFGNGAGGLGGRFTEFLAWLEETQWWSLEQMIEYQNQRPAADASAGV